MSWCLAGARLLPAACEVPLLPRVIEVPHAAVGDIEWREHQSAATRRERDGVSIRRLHPASGDRLRCQLRQLSMAFVAPDEPEVEALAACDILFADDERTRCQYTSGLLQYIATKTGMELVAMGVCGDLASKLRDER